jgi:type II secretory pathway pseudopilin PulG
MKINSQFARRERTRQGGYILLMLMLFITLLAIGATAVAPTLAFQVKRDREEEMIHRGVQYSRAIRRYVKKFGRYPMRLEELESANNLRFLRKRYKDPITGEDFKLLHLGEVQLMAGAGGAGIIGATRMANNPAGVPTLGGAATPKGITRGLSGPSGPGTQETSGEDTTLAEGGPDSNQGSGDKLSSQVFGGGPIVGVVSTSKEKTIREFSKKDHYNQWQFIYDPSMDRGGLLNTPAQPQLQLGGNYQRPGAPGTPDGVQSQPTPGTQPQPSQQSPEPQ